MATISDSIGYYSRRIAIFPLYWISRLLPKKTKLWVFGEYSGKTYADNPKYLFRYICSHHSEVSAVWLSRRREIVEEVRSEGFPAWHVHSLIGIWFAMRARVVVCCIAVNDIWGDVVSPPTVVFNLWHGTPIKKVGNDVNFGLYKKRDWCAPGKKQVAKILELLGIKAKRLDETYFAASSEVSERFRSAFGLGEDEVAVTGYPRTDPLICCLGEEMKIPKRKVIFMPTFRNKVGDSVDFFTPYGFDFDAAEEFLSENDIELWVRLHRYNLPNNEMLRRISESRMIFFHEKSDIYEDLCKFDLLVTDFSSIYFDYLLLDRPVVFAAFDIECYTERDRELYYSLEEIAGGPVARNWKEVFAGIVLQFRDDSDFIAKRAEIRDRFNGFLDGKSSQRAFEEIATRIGMNMT